MRAAVVDAYGIGRYLPARLAEHGVESVHVRSDTPDVHLSYRPEDFRHDLEYAGDLPALATRLRELGVGFVVAGTESGVVLADALSAALGTPGNGMSRPRARRDKFEMAEAVRAAGLPAARGIVTSSLAEVLAWAEDAGDWPVVLKPLASAGTDNVWFCDSPAEVREAHARIVGSTDRYAHRNDRLLAQEFLHGDEYFVNTVSRDGAHHVVEVWRYHKRRLRDGVTMYDHEEPVPPGDPVVEPLVGYTLKVLDALEIRNGAAHTEVMMTKQGPVLVESGARLGGSHVPEIVSACIGTDQVQCLAAAIADPAVVTGRRLPPYRLLTRLRYVTLINPHAGVVPSAHRQGLLRGLPSFLDMVLTIPAGTAIGPTVDLATSPGYVYLSSSDPAQVEADYQQLRRWEETELYAR